MEENLISKMNQLEQQILVHSILYYRLGCSIWTDDHWNFVARKLQRLVEDHPQLFKKTILYEGFKDFSWVSGYDLPLYDTKYTNVAMWLMREAEKRGELL